MVYVRHQNVWVIVIHSLINKDQSPPGSIINPQDVPQVITLSFESLFAFGLFAYNRPVKSQVASGSEEGHKFIGFFFNQKVWTGSKWEYIVILNSRIPSFEILMVLSIQDFNRKGKPK